jgi:hypothetical protein
VAFQKFQLDSALTLREGATLHPSPQSIDHCLSSSTCRLIIHRLELPSVSKSRALSAASLSFPHGEPSSLPAVISQPSPGLSDSTNRRRNLHIHFRILLDHWSTVRQSSTQSLLSLGDIEGDRRISLALLVRLPCVRRYSTSSFCVDSLWWLTALFCE